MTRSEVHRAGWVMLDPRTVLENGAVQICNGRIIAVDRASALAPLADRLIDHGPGVLMPALVNCHTHLELSAFKDSIPAENGFIAWIRGVIHHRNSTPVDEVIRAADTALADARTAGVGAMGDIAGPDSALVTAPPPTMAGVRFVELLGNMPPSERLPALSGSDMRLSWAGHGPHTTAPEVLQRGKTMATALGRPFSIHAAESDAEDQFIRAGTGPWAGFLDERGIDWTHWQLSPGGSIQLLNALGLLDDTTIAVHALTSDAADWTILAEQGTWVCLCPRSNQRLHGRRPPVAAMVGAGLRLCLGTDSLASCDSLSIFDELAATVADAPDLPPSQLLAMATENGAAALGLKDRFGCLRPGYNAAMVYISAVPGQKQNVAEAIVAHSADAQSSGAPVEMSS